VALADPALTPNVAGKKEDAAGEGSAVPSPTANKLTWIDTDPEGMDPRVMVSKLLAVEPSTTDLEASAPVRDLQQAVVTVCTDPTTVGNVD
jgi:hypothetical protein